MKRGFSGQPESFSISPLLSLLPVRGKVTHLEKLTSSLFARYEKVRNQLKEGSDDSRKLVSEETMLKQVLEWLEVTPQDDAAESEEETE